MSAVAVEPIVEEIEPWEVHSELVLVSPEVCRRALELLPERDPEAFLGRSHTPAALAAAPSEDSDAPALTAVALRYTIWRLGQTARFAVAVAGASIGLALIAELLN